MSFKVYFVAHGVDVDGLCCHALAHKKFNNITHFYVDYPTLINALRDLLSKPRGKLIVADVSPNNPEELASVVRALGEKHELIGWYDHHEWGESERILEAFNEYELSTTECGAELIKKALRLKDEDSELLARLAHISDYNVKSDEYYSLSLKLQKAISVANNEEIDLDKITRILSKGELEHQLINQLSSQYDEVVRKAKQRLEEQLLIKEVKGLTVYAAECEPILYMKEGARHILDQYPEADIALTTYPTGPVVVFARQDNADIVGYCKDHNGGGREQGGGFILTTTEAKQKNLIQKLIKELREYIN